MLRLLIACSLLITSKALGASAVCLEAYGGPAASTSAIKIETTAERQQRFARYKADLSREELEAVFVAEAAQRVGARVIIRRPDASSVEGGHRFLTYEGYVTAVEAQPLFGHPEVPAQLVIMMDVEAMRLETYDSLGRSVLDQTQTVASTEFTPQAAFLVDPRWPITVELAPRTSRRKASKPLDQFKTERLEQRQARLH